MLSDADDVNKLGERDWGPCLQCGGAKSVYAITTNLLGTRTNTHTHHTHTTRRSWHKLHQRIIRQPGFIPYPSLQWRAAVPRHLWSKDGSASQTISSLLFDHRPFHLDCYIRFAFDSFVYKLWQGNAWCAHQKMRLPKVEWFNKNIYIFFFLSGQ